jgi:hypothetical protein
MPWRSGLVWTVVVENRKTGAREEKIARARFCGLSIGTSLQWVCLSLSDHYLQLRYCTNLNSHGWESGSSRSEYIDPEIEFSYVTLFEFIFGRVRLFCGSLRLSPHLTLGDVYVCVDCSLLHLYAHRLGRFRGKWFRNRPYESTMRFAKNMYVF